MAKLHKQNDGSVPVTEMKDGDLAVIVDWPVETHIGSLVQKYDKALIKVGAPWGRSWPNLFESDNLLECRVRILQPGELIEV